MFRLDTILVAILCVLLGSQAFQQRLIIVMLDGVRWDYVNRDRDLNGFQRIAKEGVRVKYVTPIFPSLSYPNWYTIVTGLYAESHGIVDNKMYDQNRNELFLMGPHPNVSHEHWWNKTEPLWVTAEKNAKRTAMHYWDGCQVPIHGYKPMQCEPYREFWNWTGPRTETLAKMSEVLEWFEELETHQLALVYYEGLDAYGHRYGPDSEKTKQEMRDTDHMLDMFQDKLEASKIKDQINLIVLSDHGMTDIEFSKGISLQDVDGQENFLLQINSGVEVGILPVEGKTDQILHKLQHSLQFQSTFHRCQVTSPKSLEPFGGASAPTAPPVEPPMSMSEHCSIHSCRIIMKYQVYEDLKRKDFDGLHVYHKEEIPTDYHLKNGELNLPILVVADLGYRILKPIMKVGKGNHGYDPYLPEKDGTNQMRTIMFARGPAFRRGVVGQPIQQTDHYNIFCHILNLKPRANNGSWDRVKDLLASDAASCYQTSVLCISLSVVAITIFIFGLNN